MDRRLRGTATKAATDRTTRRTAFRDVARGGGVAAQNASIAPWNIRAALARDAFPPHRSRFRIVRRARWGIRTSSGQRSQHGTGTTIDRYISNDNT